MFTRPMHWGTLILALVVAIASAAPAGAVGYWNMPTSLSQWWGYGHGPGYHAPMVLGPVTARELVRPYAVIRLRCPPRPVCCPTGCGCDAEPLLEPSALPDAAPTAAEPAALRPSPI